ncbi:hypothetical protein LTR08_008007 [Meristemomyces frigidus]|nr:hypothetical protein LTR08_008007 [Meristemomyces frigidus]
MATVFYFNSLQRPIAAPRSRLSPKPRPKLDRRRRSTRMDFQTQHACMARFDEPTFCPSAIDTLLARYPMLPPALGGCAGTSTSDLVDDDDDDDDDNDNGGVPLHHSDADSGMTDVFAGTHLTASGQSSASWPASLEPATRSGERSILAPGAYTPRVQTSRQVPELPSTEHLYRSPTGPRTPPLYQPSPSVLGSSHPRPHSQESWEEEDGRRLRFALDGEDTSDVPQFAVPDAATMPLAADLHEATTRDSAPPWRFSWTPGALGRSRMSEHVDTAQPQSTRERSRSLGATVRPSPPQGTDPVANSGPPNPNITEPSPRTVVMHSDFLTVDDPQWSYDFADFLDTWYLRSQLDRRVPPVRLGLPQSEGFTKRLDAVCRSDVDARTGDMQGLRWQVLGVSRHDAVAARTMLHSSKGDTALLRTRSAGGVAQQRASQEESMYRFRSFTPIHRASFSHYQLRNVLAASNRSDIYFANDNKVYSTSLACPSVQNTVMDLSTPRDAAAPFRITCLAASPRSAHPAYRSSQFVVTGGFYGEYALRNLDSASAAPPPREGAVTHAYNGLVTHVHTFTTRRSGLPQAAFCANDATLRLLDTTTLRFTDTFAYAHAVNCAATSPDGRLRALVGDSQDAHITDAERGAVLATLRGHADHGFACAWAPDGVHVATGAQDGATLLWDARNWASPLRALPSAMSTPRSVHFADDNALVVAEDDDVVAVYAAGGGYEKVQEVRFFGSIAGVALLDGGVEMVVADSDKTVGGLLAFERTGRGGSGGAFGQRVDACSRAGRRRGQGARSCGGVNEVFV